MNSERKCLKIGVRWFDVIKKSEEVFLYKKKCPNIMFWSYSKFGMRNVSCPSAFSVMSVDKLSNGSSIWSLDSHVVAYWL